MDREMESRQAIWEQLIGLSGNLWRLKRECRVEDDIRRYSIVIADLEHIISYLQTYMLPDSEEE